MGLVVQIILIALTYLIRHRAVIYYNLFLLLLFGRYSPGTFASSPIELETFVQWPSNASLSGLIAS